MRTKNIRRPVKMKKASRSLPVRKRKMRLLKKKKIKVVYSNKHFVLNNYLVIKQMPEIGSPTDNNKEDLTAKNDAKGEPSCRSHRSYSTKSTTANSVKKDSLVDQKEEMDSRMSLKSTESATKEADANMKQEEATVQSQA